MDALVDTGINLHKGIGMGLHEELYPEPVVVSGREVVQPMPGPANLAPPTTVTYPASRRF